MSKSFLSIDKKIEGQETLIDALEDQLQRCIDPAEREDIQRRIQSRKNELKHLLLVKNS